MAIAKWKLDILKGADQIMADVNSNTTYDTSTGVTFDSITLDNTGTGIVPSNSTWLGPSPGISMNWGSSSVNPSQLPSGAMERAKTSVLPEPEIKDPLLEGNFLKEYERLSDKFGYANPKLLDNCLMLALQKEEIPVYPIQVVAGFLDGIVEKENITRRANHESGNLYWFWNPINEYKKDIPIEALRIMDKVHTHMGDKVEFFVSDYAVTSPDPFLMAKVKGGNDYYVLCHWDEPNFKINP